MAVRYAIHPSIGIARIGNSRDFYLAPVETGGLPIECDAHGNELRRNGIAKPVRRFKKNGAIRRQGAKFGIFAYHDDGRVEKITAHSRGVARITWTVHLANKKGCWFTWDERNGDTTLSTPGHDNSYAARKTLPRNAGKKGAARKSAIFDPGPRTLRGPSASSDFTKKNAPRGYPVTYPPKPPAGQRLIGTLVDTLGDVVTDRAGWLVVVGGFGQAGGPNPVASSTGADDWFDDLSDGPVRCELTLSDGSVERLDAWCIVGQPKYAPELVNVVTLDDVMFDVAVREHGILQDWYDPAAGGWNQAQVVNFDRDVAPIFEREAHVMWAANVPGMGQFAVPRFDVRDPCARNRANRMRYASFFRTTATENRLDAHNHVPLMPLLAGENPLANEHQSRFLCLTQTQHYVLQQWARGSFVTTPAPPLGGAHPLDRASVGNCVGAPLSPGVEVTWSVRNPAIYAGPYRILHRHRHDEEHFQKSGLDPDEDETDGKGCEPGDLTKRLNVPWHGDFQDCTAQIVSLNAGKSVDDDTGVPIPPIYYAYWWPAQVPVHVISGATTTREQTASGVPAGAQVAFMRGFTSFDDVLRGWTYLGFVVNRNRKDGRMFPYFVEAERDHDRFVASAVTVGDIGNVQVPRDGNFIPIFYLKKDPDKRHAVPHKTRRLAIRY